MTETPNTRSRAPARLQRQTMAGQVADELRQKILAGDYAEGEQLLQEQLAADFGISKVPVREALHLLEAEGLIVQQFHRGAVIASLAPEQLMEIFELRTQIEVWLLGLAMENATEADCAMARSMNDALGADTDPVKGWDLNWKFHEALYLPANKPYVLDHLRILHSRTARYVRKQYDIATNRAQILDQHSEILDAYAQRDPKAQELLAQHILGAARTLTDHLITLRTSAVGQE